MTPEEMRQRASDLFDESGAHIEAPLLETSEDWNTWASIANHLQSAEVVALPNDFGSRVQSAIRRARFWSEVLLILKVCGATALILTFVVANALGFDWWHRLSTAVEPAHVAASLHSLFNKAGTLLPNLSPLLQFGRRIWPLVPLLLITFAITAVVAELALFRILRLGPFRAKGI
jgi:hypothetical protein